MTRPLRPAFEGALYHLTSRGNEKKAIFYSDDDRQHFLRLLGIVVERFGWICYAYCLMSNHYHLLVETPLANVAQGMRQLNGVYALYFNRSRRRVGHLFQGRFKGILVEKEAHLLELSRYIVLNPVRAGMCRQAGEYRWSSYNSMIGKAPRQPFLSTQGILERFGRTPAEAVQAYERFVQEGVADRPWDRLKGQIFLGSDAFVQELQEKTDAGMEIPRAQRQAVRPSLAELLKSEKGFMEAYRGCGYRMREIAEYLGVHYTTVSRRMKRLELGAGVRSCDPALAGRM